MEAVWIALGINAVIIGMIVYSIIEVKRTLNAPIKTARAYLLKKCRVADNDENGFTYNYTYYAVFKLSSGKKLTLSMNEPDYVFMPSKGPCNISYKYKTLIDFQALVEA